MDRTVLEFLAGLHGVAFDENKSDEDLQKDLAEAIKKASEPPTPPTPPAPTPPTPPTSSNLSPAVMSELEKQAKENTYLAAVLADLTAAKKSIAELETANRLQEVRRRLADVGNARRVLTPHVGQKLSELIAAMPPKAGDRVLEVVKEILTDGGTVELGERGRSVIDGGKDAGVRFEAAVRKLQEADSKLTYADAVTAVAAADPDLFDSYRQSATSEWR